MALSLLLIVIHNYYGLKSNFKFNVLVNSLFLQGKETFEQFKQKINQPAQEGREISFPEKMWHSLEDIKQAFLLPQEVAMNDEQCLFQMKCLLAARKVYLDYLLNLFSVLEKIDNKTGNDRVGVVCVEKILYLFVPLLITIYEQIQQLKTSHRQQLEKHFNPEQIEDQGKLKLWFDILDIHFEHDPEIRKLKLYVSTLGASDPQAWAVQMNDRFQDFPPILQEINAIQQIPLDYQGIHNYAIVAYKKIPAIQQKIKEGMKIIESMQDRFQTFLKSSKTKNGADYSPDFSDVYDLFHTLQEAREGSSFIRDDEKTFLKRRDNKTAEMEQFAQLSPHKQEKFLTLLYIAMQNPAYIQSIAWQVYYQEDAGRFTALVNYIALNRTQSEMSKKIVLGFSKVLKQTEAERKGLIEAQRKEAQQKKKQEQFAKNIAQLQQVTGQVEDEIISETYEKRKAAKRRKEEREQYYDGVKRLTFNELEDYLKDRRAQFQLHLHELREKRASMNQSQQKVSESTEVFVEAELEIMDVITAAGNEESGEVDVNLDVAAVDKFEKETLEALNRYSESCPAQGQFKKEYFESRTHEIKGMLATLKEQAKEETVSGDAAVRIMDSVHDVMGIVEQNMQNLASDLPADAQEKLKVLLEKEEKGFNAMMEKEFEILIRGNPVSYPLKAFIILPLPAKQKMIALQAFTFNSDNALSEAEHKALENFLYFRSNFATSRPLDVLDKEGAIQTIKLGNYLWYESLLYQTIALNVDNNPEKITLLDLYGLPLKPEGEFLFSQHAQLVEKILSETKEEEMDDDFREKLLRDTKNKHFEINLAGRYPSHNKTYDLFPGGAFDEKVFAEVIEWYRLRKEDRQINYYEMRKGDPP